MKDCKVIVVCGNPIRDVRPKGSCQFHHHPQTIQTVEDLYGLWEVILEIETTVDGGVPFDTIIMCNGSEAFEWWKEYDGTPTKNGTLRVIERRNHGGSFAGYDHAYRHLDYNGYLFTEEDILVFGPEYYKQFKERYHEQPGFVCAVGISRGKRFERHCHGGVGYTERKVLDAVADEHGRLPYPHRKGWHRGTTILQGEIPFTSRVTKCGYELLELHGHISDWVTTNQCMPSALFSHSMLDFTKKGGDL